jgi:hypothetical protein
MRSLPYSAGESVRRREAMTDLPPRVLGGYKGYLKSPIYQGLPVSNETKGLEEQAGVEQAEVGVPGDGDVGPIESRRVTPGQPTQGQGTPGQSPDQTMTILEAGPGDGQALTVLLGKPYLIQLRNAYVSPDPRYPG